MIDEKVLLADDGIQVVITELDGSRAVQIRRKNHKTGRIATVTIFPRQLEDVLHALDQAADALPT